MRVLAIGCHPDDLEIACSGTPVSYTHLDVSKRQPLGLLFGFLIAKVSFNWLVEQGNPVSSGIKSHQVPLFSLTIMLICIFVSFLTVVLALRKPMKIVSRISPIEATRYLGDVYKRQPLTFSRSGKL